MTELGKIQREYHLPVQSHLSENFGEIAWVKELCPTSRFYGDAYDMFGLFGTKPAFNTNEADFASASGLNTTDNTAAHISSDGASVSPYHHGTLRPLHRRRDPDDQRPGRLRRPLSESNTDIASGIAPVRRYLDMGLHVGLGTDVAGGFLSLHVPCYGRCHPGFQAPLAPDGSDPGPGYLWKKPSTWLRSVVAPSSEKSAPSKKAMNLTP